MSLKTRLAKLEAHQPPPVEFVGSGRFWDLVGGAAVPTPDERAEMDAMFNNLPADDRIERMIADARAALPPGTVIPDVPNVLQ